MSVFNRQERLAAHSSIYDIQGKEETALETQVRLCRNLRQANTEIRQQAGKKISRSFYIFGCFPLWLASKGFCLELEVGYTYPSHPLACLDRKKQTQIKATGKCLYKVSWSPSETELLWATAAASPDAGDTELMDQTKYTTVLTWPFSVLLQEED